MQQIVDKKNRKQTHEIELIFLGTGGARFSMITQKRHTGGIRFIKPLHMQIDPGPGSIAYSNMNRLNPSKIEALLVSHCHTDHYTDAEVFVEAMTDGATKKRGVLIGSKSVILGSDVFDQAISRYHKTLPQRTVALSPGHKEIIGSLEVLATSAHHADPDTIGFRLNFPTCDIGYISDTEYFSELASQFVGTRLLIVSVLRPAGSPWKGHLSTDDAICLARQIHPEVLIMTHFGMKMIFAHPSKQAASVQRATGIRTIAATDNMQVKVGRQIVVEA